MIRRPRNLGNGDGRTYTGSEEPSTGPIPPMDETPGTRNLTSDAPSPDSPPSVPAMPSPESTVHDDPAGNGSMDDAASMPAPSMARNLNNSVRRSGTPPLSLMNPFGSQETALSSSMDDGTELDATEDSGSLGDDNDDQSSPESSGPRHRAPEGGLPSPRSGGSGEGSANDNSRERGPRDGTARPPLTPNAGNRSSARGNAQSGGVPGASSSSSAGTSNGTSNGAGRSTGRRSGAGRDANPLDPRNARTSGGSQSQGKSTGTKRSDGKPGEGSGPDGSGDKKSIPRRMVDKTKDKVKQGVGDAKQAAKMAVRNALPQNVAARKAEEIALKAKQRVEQAKQLAKAAKQAARQTVQAVQRGVKAVSRVVHTIIQLFVPPQVFVTLGAILLVFGFLLSLGIVQTYGPSSIDCVTSGGSSSSNSGSSSDGGSSSSSGTDEAIWNDNAKAIAKEFQKAGFSKAAAASAMGNFYQESRFNPNAVNASSGAYGIAQWLGGRHTSLVAFASSKGKPKNDIGVQVGFALEEAKNPSTWIISSEWAALLKKDFPGQGTSGNDLRMGWAGTKGDDAGLKKGVAIWLAAFERPGPGEAVIEARQSFAQEVYKHLNEVDGKWASEGSIPDAFKNGAESTSSNADATNAGQKASELVCGDSKGSGTVAGAIGGFKECDGAGMCDFSWMCDSMHICKPGDYGIIPAPYAYQCVWYAWTRAAMVYKDSYGKSWNTIQGNGGDIWANAKGQPGWVVSDTPQAGDIVSGSGKPFSDGGPAGHVAFVEKVEKGDNGWKIYISEGNANGSASFNSYNTRWIDQNSGASLHFVRNTAWKK